MFYKKTSDYKMSQESKKSTIIKSVLIIIGIAGAGVLGYLWGSDLLFGGGPPKQITPTIDGDIGEREWKRATYYNYPFYLDVDNEYDSDAGARNVDGWNYFHVAEDANNYYVAADLCSDRTNNPDGEWFSVMMANQLPDFNNNELLFQSFVNHGYESIVYNVSGNEPYPYEFSDSINNGYFSVPLIPGVDTVNLVHGSADGDIYDLWNADNENLTLSSEQAAPDGYPEANYIIMEISINVTQKFPHRNISWFASKITDLDLELTLTASKDASPTHEGFAEVFNFTVFEHDEARRSTGDSGYSAYSNDEFLTANEEKYAKIDLAPGFMNDTNGMLYLTLHCSNELNGTDDASFSLDVEKLWLEIDTTDSFYAVVDTTVEESNYDLKWTFGPSENCAVPHRMFECRISKTEFPDAPDDTLFLALAGYGTMALEGTNYWETPLDLDNQVILFSNLESLSDLHRLDMSL